MGKGVYMRLKGTGKKKGSGTRTERPIEFKLRVAELHLVEKKSVKVALATACVEYKLPCTDGMTTAPHSFWGMYKDSINSGFKNKTPAVLEFAKKHPELFEDEPEQAAAPTTDAVADAEQVLEESDTEEASGEDESSDDESIDEEEFAEALEDEQDS